MVRIRLRFGRSSELYCCALVAAQNACSGKLYLLGRVFFGVATVGFEQNFTWCVRHSLV